MSMHPYFRVFFAVLTIASASTAMADSGIKITSPADGDKVKASDPVHVIYEISPGPGGDHAHIYINDKEAGILRKLKSSYSLDPLPAGQHTICVKVVNRGHTPIGQESCVKVNVG
ncbi:MAG: hypothetical protein IDH49_10400 [Gammaproteobacteria bacterium]|nr:hypothetical protein [Gammaproteobacteria bacterium]